MRFSHHLLITATIGWMAVALVWGVDTFVFDISGVPIELAYMTAFMVSAVVGGLVFHEAEAIAAHAEFGSFSFLSPSSFAKKLRDAQNRRRLNRAQRTEYLKARKSCKNQRRW